MGCGPVAAIVAGSQGRRVMDPRGFEELGDGRGDLAVHLWPRSLAVEVGCIGRAAGPFDGTRIRASSVLHRPGLSPARESPTAA